MRLWVLGGFPGEDVQKRFGTWGDGGTTCGSPLIRATATAAFGLHSSPKLDSIDLRDGWRWLKVAIVPQIFQWHLMCFHILLLFGKASRGSGELGFRDARLKIKWTSGHRAAGVELAQAMGLNRGPHWKAAQTLLTFIVQRLQCLGCGRT